MPILTEIIAKVLALTDQFLEFFVQVQYTAGQPNDCSGAWATMNTTVTACGAEFIDYLDKLAVMGLQILGQLMPALLVTNAKG